MLQFRKNTMFGLLFLMLLIPWGNKGHACANERETSGCADSIEQFYDIIFILGQGTLQHGECVVPSCQDDMSLLGVTQVLGIALGQYDINQPEYTIQSKVIRVGFLGLFLLHSTLLI